MTVMMIVMMIVIMIPIAFDIGGVKNRSVLITILLATESNDDGNGVIEVSVLEFTVRWW